MNTNSWRTLTVLIVLLLAQATQARVYKYKEVGDYAVRFDLAEHKGQSLLSFMKQTLYPAIKGESFNRSSSSHIKSIELGEGVELRLAEDVSTFHVKYKRSGETKAERSGRSFGAVGELVPGGKVRYIADASYKHYLRTLEKALIDEEQAKLFYKSILQILLNSDPSGLDLLNTETKRVASDFVAVYIAEQYRRLIKKDGQALAKYPEWDNAHLHVTLLANFHAGQETPGMFYHGQYSTEVYNQITKKKGEALCAYRDKKNPLLSMLNKRDFNLTDYWQFNAECERSGVNITRRDFVRMSAKITEYLNDQGLTENLESIYTLTRKHVKTRKNINDRLVDFIVSDRAPHLYEDVDLLIDAIVGYLVETREHAHLITDSL